MSYLFTSESVSEGHPDKVSDQISDGILDNFLAFDPKSKVACETLVTTGQVILSGEVTSNTYIDVQDIARNIIKDIGYNNDQYKFSGESCAVMSLIHEQSEDILRGVERNIKENQGAGPSRNYGINLCSGEYIAFCDCDDLWKPEKLEKQFRFMKEFNLSFSFTSYEKSWLSCCVFSCSYRCKLNHRRDNST